MKKAAAPAKKPAAKTAAPAAKKAAPAKKPAGTAKAGAKTAAKAPVKKAEETKKEETKEEAKVQEEPKKEEEKISTFNRPQEPAELPKLKYQAWEKPAGSEDVKGKELERGKMPSFKTCELRELEMECTWAEENQKYMYIADMHG